MQVLRFALDVFAPFWLIRGGAGLENPHDSKPASAGRYRARPRGRLLPAPDVNARLEGRPRQRPGPCAAISVDTHCDTPMNLSAGLQHHQRHGSASPTQARRPRMKEAADASSSAPSSAGALPACAERSGRPCHRRHPPMCYNPGYQLAHAEAAALRSRAGYRLHGTENTDRRDLSVVQAFPPAARALHHLCHSPTTRSATLDRPEPRGQGLSSAQGRVECNARVCRRLAHVREVLLRPPGRVKARLAHIRAARPSA
jgi:hypothetical protein